MRPYTVKRLLVWADLSVTSFQDAVALLSPDMPLTLYVTTDECSEEFARWLWDNSRVTSIALVPKEICNYPNSWALCGYNSAVYSKGF